ncbi:creatininase family protein [Myxococcota bacterium]|nr:creatininase family protein [Myxococcota bacterium]
MRLAALAYPEVEAKLRAGAVLLWPTGSTEAHGPHLPLDTDVVIAEQTCARAAPVIRTRFGLEALVMPPLTFTVTEFAAPFAGTITIPKATAIAYVRDVASSAAALGARAVCLVNAHLEPEHRFALRDAVKAANERAPCPVVLCDPSDRRFAATLTEEFARGACHAGQYETSLVLAASERDVREDARRTLAPKEIDLLARIKAGARSFLDAGADTAYFGNPRGATVEEGERTYTRLVEILCTVLDEALAPARPAGESTP